MPRTPTNVRLSETEKRVLSAAAERRGMPRSTWLREAALEASVDVLERELEDVRHDPESDD